MSNNMNIVNYLTLIKVIFLALNIYFCILLKFGNVFGMVLLYFEIFIEMIKEIPN